MDVPRIPTAALAILAGGALVALYIAKKGSVSAAASSAAAAAVNAVGGAASGAVGAVGQAVGLPTPDETTRDPAVARWLIDTSGYAAASRWSSAPALFSAVLMGAGTGTPPPRGTALAQANPAPTWTSGDVARMEHRAENDEWRFGGPITPGLTYDPTDPNTWGLPL